MDLHLAMIVGTLYSNSRVIYGCTPSGVPIFRFQSQDGDQFRVSCRKRSSTPMRALIKCLDKMNQTPLRPEGFQKSSFTRGELVEILGPVGNPDTEYLTILLHRHLPRNSLSINHHQLIHEIPLNRSYEDQTLLEVVTIDPENCLDADDALSYRVLDENTVTSQSNFEVWVHITDVASQIPLDHPYDPHQSNRWTSVYLPNRVIHMLPTKYSEEKCSLHIGKDNSQETRQCLSVCYRGQGPSITKISLNRTRISVSRNLVYGQIDPMITGLLKCTRDLKDFAVSPSCAKLEDQHQLIEYWMVRTNAWIAELLAQSFPDSMIFRAHDDQQQVPIDLSPEHPAYRHLIQRSPAKYQGQPGRHCGLAVDYYTHFTSPIRRGIDLMIQRLIHCYLDSSPSPWNPDEIRQACESANEYTRLVRKADRDIRRYELIRSLDRCRNDPTGRDLEISCEGYLISLDPPRIYLPGYDFSQRLNLSPYTHLSSNPHSLTIRCDDQIRVFQLYERLSLTVVANSETPYHRLMIRVNQP